MTSAKHPDETTFAYYPSTIETLSDAQLENLSDDLKCVSELIHQIIDTRKTK